MFDLEKSLNDWRSNYRNKKQITSSTIDELESHLRDSFEHLTEKHSAEKAFALAVEQLGPPETITSEFQKNNDLSITDRLVLRGHHILLFVLLSAYACSVFPIRLPFSGMILLNVHVAFCLLGYGTALFLGLAGCYGILRARSEAVSFSHSYRTYCRRTHLLIFGGTLVGFVLGMIWANQAWGKYFGWDPKEIGALAVIIVAFGFFIIQRKRTLSMHQLGQLNLALSITTMIAWFGANGSLTESRLLMQTLFYGWISIQLVAFFLPAIKSTTCT